MQAIEVKYLGPTNHKGTRYKAICDAGSKTYSAGHLDHWLYEHKVDTSDYNRSRLAAEFLRNSLGWTHPNYGRMFGGSLKNGNYVFVFSNVASDHDELTMKGENDVSIDEDRRS